MIGRMWILLLCLFLMELTGCRSQEKRIILRYAHQGPLTGWSSIHCVEPWLNRLEAETKGRVRIQAFYGQTLTKGQDAWSAAKSGLADIAWCFHGYWPGMTPLTDVISLPALPFSSAEQGSAVLWKLYRRFPQIQDEFKDVQVLLLFTSEPYILLTRDKAVKTLEDLRGLKIRMTGGPPTEMMRALGGVPMLIPMPDVYISLQKGVIDGLGAPWEAINVWRFYEVAQYYAEVPFGCVYFSIAMNKRKWNSLPKDIQDALMRVGGLEGSKFWGRNFFDAMKTETVKILREQGSASNIYTLSPVERERWVNVGGRPIWAQWVEAMKTRGHPEAQAILDSVLETLPQSATR